MLYFLCALALSILFTLIVRKISLKLKIVDSPDCNRKKHLQKTALLGGTAIFFSFWVIVAYLIFFTNKIGDNIHLISLISIFVGGAILMILGFFDDKAGLSPKFRIAISSLAVLIVILFGIDLNAITNPLGGAVKLNFFQFDLGAWGALTLAGDLIVFFWLMGMIYTTKILDGLDGLTVGIVAIGAMMIFFLSSTVKFHQADVALLSLVLAGSCLGFLIFNFYPAKIFLGEGGGLWLGFMLGAMAVVAGGKIATALLVMAVPVLDLAWVAVERLRHGDSLFKGDRRHFHYRLVDAGLSHRQAVLTFYSIALIFGISTLVLPSKFKLMVLAILAVSFVILEIIIRKKYFYGAQKKH
ncbi:MAG: MraY family glycosyltransferase [bacterium]